LLLFLTSMLAFGKKKKFSCKENASGIDILSFFVVRWDKVCAKAAGFVGIFARTIDTKVHTRTNWIQYFPLQEQGCNEMLLKFLSLIQSPEEETVYGGMTSECEVCYVLR
jgi:hypothetical protein